MKKKKTFKDLKVGQEFYFVKSDGGLDGPYRKTHLSNGKDRWNQCWYLDKDYWAYNNYMGPTAEVISAIPEGEE